MPPAAVTTLDPRAACHACGQPLPPQSAVCPGCGAAHGESNRCPHCHAVADVEAHAALGFRCLVCGGPRVALDVSGVTSSAATRAALSTANERHAENVAYSGGGLAVLALGALALVLTTVVVATTSAGVLPSLAGYVGALVPVILGLLSLARGARARKQRGDALHSAQVSALADVQAVTGVLDARRVAEIMRLTPERAELLLAEASVASLLDQVPPPRVRVGSVQATEPGSLLDEAHREQEGPGARTVRGDTEI